MANFKGAQVLCLHMQVTQDYFSYYMAHTHTHTSTDIYRYTVLMIYESRERMRAEAPDTGDGEQG